MKPYPGYEAKAFGGARATLPAGGYVAKIQNVDILTYGSGEKMRIAYDVAEGEYTDIFKKDYINNENADKKWRGNFDLWIPKGDGSESDTWSKRAFENFMASVEDSNDDYHWDWNEKSLKGKLFGALVRDKEWEYNGKTGWTTECSSATTIAKIREGNFKIPKAKALNKAPDTNYGAPAVADSNPFDDGQLPWA